MYHIHVTVSLLHLVIVSYRCVSMKGRFCDLPAAENDVISVKKRLNFEVKMQYTAGTKWNNSFGDREERCGLRWVQG